MEKFLTLRLSTRGRLTVPKSIRDRHGWRPGAEIFIEDTGDHLILREAFRVQEASVEELVGCAGYTGRRRSLEEMEEGIARGARKDR
jgi:AbrB family looped-hinge helix DNA binding protein